MRRVLTQVPGGRLLLREHPENEAALLVRLERRGDDGVFPGGESEAVTHFSCVDERAAHGHGSLSQQDVRTQMNVAEAFILSHRQIKKAS